MSVQLHPIPPVLDHSDSASGAAMDRPIAPMRFAGLRRWLPAVLALGAGAALLAWTLPRGLAVRQVDLTVSEVRQGEFRDELLLRVQVAPAQQVLLDATEGGRVDAVLAHDGDMLRQGDLLYRLSNPQREQEVLRLTAEIAQQQVNLAMQRTALASSQAQIRRDLSNLGQELLRASTELQRQQALAAQGFVSAAALEDAKLKQTHQQRLLDQASADGEVELATRRQAVTDMERAVQGLSDGLAVVRKAADGLSARAPRDGQLSGFHLEVGASVKPGDRLGRIDDISAFKLTAQVDEFYLARVQPGIEASLEADGKSWPLRLTQKLPQVKEGRFGVELAFTEPAPARLQAGQNLNARLQLGRPGPALLLDDGPFFTDTGGSWVYVLDADGKAAERRSVRLGRRAAGQIEVLDGLRPGERAITSKVSAYGDAPRLRITP